ncbi:ODR10 protein [Aphelenchoides avenae]|nr:ODR10 protein [Aphelenchus avenae]
MAFYEHGEATKWWAISALVLRVYGDLTCFTCGYLSLRLLRQQMPMMSTFTHRVSVQYTRVLLVQATVPFIFFAVPAAVYLLPHIINVPILASAVHLAVFMGSAHPFTEPITCIVLVRQFRESIFGFWCKKKVAPMGLIVDATPTDNRYSY